jgi:alkylhydroperoxidase/carboxymuconolactone decarboxylase family protein YurZ
MTPEKWVEFGKLLQEIMDNYDLTANEIIEAIKQTEYYDAFENFIYSFEGYLPDD